MKTALYRHFDAGGQLLYVGISNDVLRRLAQHLRRSEWFPRIARVDVEWLPDRACALVAEARAIEAEAPRWNKYQPLRRGRVVPGNFAIEHVASGRRDGNYFDLVEADDMLEHWSMQYPQERFRLLAAEPGAPGGATAFAPPLRPSDAHVWSAAA